MKNIFVLICLVVVHHMNLVADGDVTPQKTEQTFVQEYSGYSITLPEGWKLVGDENDAVPIAKVSGLYRYAPGPKKEMTLADWAYFGEPAIRLQIGMVIRPPHVGIGKIMREIKFPIVQKLTLEDSGTASIQNIKAEWFVGKCAGGLSSYIVLFGKESKFYIVEFLAHNMTPETKLKCDQIMKTFAFLN